MKRYKITLNSEERKYLKEITSKGKHAAQKIIRAQILLKADENQKRSPWKDEKISEALDVTTRTVERTRQAFVEEGLEKTLTRKTQERPGRRKFDGVKEAHLVTLACSSPPEGRESWTLELLGNKMVELKHFDKVSRETIRRTLKKTK